MLQLLPLVVLLYSVFYLTPKALAVLQRHQIEQAGLPGVCALLRSQKLSRAAMQ